MSELSSHVPGCELLVALEDLLVQYKVDLVFNGHMHMFERTPPVYKGVTYNTTDSNVYDNP